MVALPRLTRRQLLDALRAHASAHGIVTTASLHAHAPAVLRSIPLHFAGIAAARETAGVSAPPMSPRAKTGPKPGSAIGKRPLLWSRARVLHELRKLQALGQRTAWADLMNAGQSALIHAAQVYVGGLRAARQLAGIKPPPRRSPKRVWTPPRVIARIRRRRERAQPLSFSHAPPILVAAGVRHFGSWREALLAAGVNPDTVCAPRSKYTREAIIKMLQREAKRGSDLRSITLAKTMKLEAVRREFGTLRDALIAAGLGEQLQQRKHGHQKWSRERVIAVLRERAARGVATLTPGLRRVMQLYFGGAEHARRAAGVPSPRDLRDRQRSGPGPGRAREWPRARPPRRRRALARIAR